MSILSDDMIFLPVQPEAIFFDLDDTILMYNSAAKRAWQEMCNRFAVRVNGGDAVGLNQAIRQRADWFWGDPERDRQGRCTMVATRASIIAMALQSYELDDLGLAREMAEVMTALHGEYIEPFPGAIETLKLLRAAGIRLGLITNGGQTLQYQKIDRFGLRDLFENILVEEEFGVGKPEVKIFHSALCALGVTPGEAWMVGDNLAFDIAPANHLGMRTFWHDFRRSGLPDTAVQKPDHIIYELTDLIKLYQVS